CGKFRISSIDQFALINPALVVAVTSRYTEVYDRGEKLNHYKQCPSFRAVVIVSHRRRQLTLVDRTNDGWQQRAIRSGETLDQLGSALAVSVGELYDGIALSDP